MKKLKFIAALAIAAMSTGLSADWAVYWEVEGAYDVYAERAVEFDYATISAVDGAGNKTQLYQYDVEARKPATPPIYAVLSDGVLSVDGDRTSTGSSIYSGSSSSLDNIDYFLVGLYSFAEDRLGWQRYSKSDVLSYIWDTSDLQPENSTALKVTNVVPEPTSALLMLLGMAGLALRRRRA